MTRPIPVRPRSTRRRNLIVASIAVLVMAAWAAATLNLADGWRRITAPTAAITAAPSATATPTPTPAATAAPRGWETIHYADKPGVPTGYFGPGSPCIKDRNPEACISDLKEVTKHDPTVLSVWLAKFNLLPSQGNLDPKASDYAGKLETLRADYAKKLEDWRLRKAQQPRLAAVLDSMTNLSVTALSGPYYTTFVDEKGGVHQSTKDMDPAKNFALTGTTPDGVKHSDKLDCGHQPVSKKPLVGVPTRHKTTTPPPTTDRTRPPHVVVEKKSCPPNMHGGWVKGKLVCKDGPDKGPAKKVSREQEPDALPTRADHKQPDKPADPPKKAKNPDPPAPPKTPRPEPPDPADGAPDPTEAPTACVVAPGEITC